MCKAEITKLAEILNNSKNIVFFGGAGVSTESGIPDFRGAHGVWNEKLRIELSPEQLVSHTAYCRYPEVFFEFYRDKLLYPQAEPNACHIALAKLEAMGKLKAVVTQNIDGLHQRAGSRTVYELHGSVHRNYCEECHAFYDINFILNTEGVPCCTKCGGRVKPDVVLFEEGLDNDIIRDSIEAISQADTMIIAGTSLVVQPAASLIDYFSGRSLILINMTATAADRRADLVLRAPVGEVMQEVMRQLVD